MSDNIVRIFSDGACLNNPGPGGFASVIQYKGKEYIIKGRELNKTTNNRMELTAVVEALERFDKLIDVTIEVYTDSQYVKNGITSWIHSWKKNNWKKSNGKAVMNVDLWQDLDKYASRHKISWHWIRGHSGHPENEYANKMAQEQAALAKQGK